MNINYMLISLVMLFIAGAIFFLMFEKRKPKARRIVMISVMSAITVVANLMCAYTVPLHAGTSLVIITGIAFGPEAGLLTGVIARFVCNFFMGQGMWTPWQMFAWGLIGALSGMAFFKTELTGYFDDKKAILKKKAKVGMTALIAPVASIILCELVGYVIFIFTAAESESFFGYRLYLYGFVGIIIAVILARKRLPANFITVTIFTFIVVFVIYGGLMNIAALFMNSSFSADGSSYISLANLKLLYITGVPYDALHALGAAMCTFLFGDSMLQKLERARIKYGI